MEIVSDQLMIILNSLISLVNRVLRFLGLISSDIDSIDKVMKIYIKWGPDMVPINLSSEWSVSDLKEALSKKLNIRPSDLRIIFAGKELHDGVKIQDCDVGQHSIIHAVRSKKTSIEVTKKAACPLNQTVLSLQLSDEDRSESQGQKMDLKRVHFFVYCSHPCKDVMPGKLRVRCSTCLEGTLTVNKDPTCWDDVLCPGRIFGTCQSEECNGTVAEFYFKCASHVTSPDDSAVALYLIKNNFKLIPCIACTDISPVILVFPCADGHVICLECFQSYCISYLNDRRFIQDEILGYTLPCAAGCPDSLIKETHHFRVLGEEQYSRYQQFGAEECLLQAGGVLCPQPGCGAGLLPDPECRRVTCVQQGGLGCGYVFCRQCLQGYHIGSCESLQPNATLGDIHYAITDERAEYSRWDEDSKNTIKITTKPCPKCRTPTEKDGGCMHMVCTRSQCGFHWCWVCQEEWTRDCMANHWFDD